jgi:4-aminobutyrate aminotransferase-like enzyme
VLMQVDVLIISCGSQTIRFRPFLDTTVKHVDIVVKVLREIFVELKKAKL